jgi:hypothetical protein
MLTFACFAWYCHQFLSQYYNFQPPFFISYHQLSGPYTNYKPMIARLWFVVLGQSASYIVDAKMTLFMENLKHDNTHYVLLSLLRYSSCT